MGCAFHLDTGRSHSTVLSFRSAQVFRNISAASMSTFAYLALLHIYGMGEVCKPSRWRDCPLTKNIEGCESNNHEISFA